MPEKNIPRAMIITLQVEVFAHRDPAEPTEKTIVEWLKPTPRTCEEAASLLAHRIDRMKEGLMGDNGIQYDINKTTVIDTHLEPEQKC